MKWKEAARKATEAGFNVFPVNIKWDQSKNKWDKPPLTKNGYLNASMNVDDHGWDGANGFGLVMDGDFYALDIDDYKADSDAGIWLQNSGISLDTRTHKTVSGGYHYIYRTEVPTRQRANVVNGLDTRGAGSGYIAFGEGYEVVNPTWDLAVLPKHISKFFNDGGGSPTSKDDDWGYLEPDEEVVEAKIRMVFSRSPRLWLRKFGYKRDLPHGQSGSELELSIAGILHIHGFDRHEIVWAMLNWFDLHSGDYQNNPLRSCKRKAIAASRGKTRWSSEYERDELYNEDPQLIANILADHAKGKTSFERMLMLMCVIGALGKNELSWEIYWRWLNWKKPDSNESRIRDIWDVIEEDEVVYGWPEFVQLVEDGGANLMGLMADE